VLFLLDSWSMAIRDEWRQLGYYPVIIGGKPSLEKLKEKLQGDHSVTGIINEVNNYFLEINSNINISKENLPEVPVPWQTVLPLPTNGTDEIIYLVFFPVNNPWEVIAWMNYSQGGMSPVKHCIIHKYWYENYKTEPVIINEKVIELQVYNKPRTFEEAQQVCGAQLSYSPKLLNIELTPEMITARILKGCPWIMGFVYIKVQNPT
jgi:hypothetical protein